MNIDNIFLMFHLFSVIAWFMTLPIGILLRRVISEIDAVDKVKEFASWGRVNSYLANGGALGILITGGALAGERWFRFEENGFWLAIKQVLFFLVFIYAIIVMRSATNNLNEVIADDQSSKDEVLSIYRNVERQNHIILTIVIINTILATLKPF